VVDGQGNLQPIYSGHFDKDKKPVFYGYHWLVREDGMGERLLPDEATGWHAGNWEVNCESIGICVDDDLTSKQPSEAVIAGIADIIRRHYSTIIVPGEDMVIGHNEVTKTVCPGNEFLDGWKQTILDRLESS
jgi:N-acetyl-anhydromuramyl-L-alanine amidase AmpD